MEDYRHLDSPRDPPPRYHARWDDDSPTDVKNEEIKEPGASIWMQRIQLVRQRTMPVVEKVPSYLKNNVVPALKTWLTKKQCYAFLLLGVFAVLPCALIFSLSTSDKPFGSKTIDCGQLDFGSGNATVKGIDGLFVIDSAYGNMPFSLAKFIDVSWDLIVGRGMQLTAWYVSYQVFTDALLRVIERHPAPYRTFSHLCLQGASLGSIRALILDMKRYRSRRSTWLFAYMIIATSYVVALPTILSAMTGYVSTSEPFVILRDDDSSEIVRMADFIYGYQVFDAYKLGEANGSCLASTLFGTYQEMFYAQSNDCDCMLPNGTRLDAQDGYNYNLVGYQCTYNYTNNTQYFTYPLSDYGDGQNYEENYYGGQNYSCNYLYNITINNHNYKFDRLHMTDAWCYNGAAYSDNYLMYNSQCMPSTTQNTYRWGFCTMLSGVFVILQLIWAISMYVVWQDAQSNSALVRGGYKMTTLRAVFSLSEAAQQRLGMDNEELMRMEPKRLDDDLYDRKTLVDYGMWERKKLPFLNENEASSSRS